MLLKNHVFQNGYEWETGDWPYLQVECLNKRWSHATLPSCRSEFRTLQLVCFTFPLSYFSNEKVRGCQCQTDKLHLNIIFYEIILSETKHCH